MKRKLFFIVLVFCAVTILTGCQSVEPVQMVDPDDPLTGYFQIIEQRRRKSQPATVIPVLKIDGDYYSVCRGFEVPFKQGPGGLEWAMEGSSMVGTTIRRRPDGNVYIIIRDSQSEMFTGDSENSHDTGPRPMKRVGKPAAVLDPASPPPHSNDDFIGCYQPRWMPYVRVTINKEGQKFFAESVIMEEKDKWRPDKNVVELTPFADRLGFTNFDKRHSIEYNEHLKRFEMVMAASPPIRMPLVRVDPMARPSEIILTGIPSWH